MLYLTLKKIEYYGPTGHCCTVSNSGFPHPPLQANCVGSKDMCEKIITASSLKQLNITNKPLSIIFVIIPTS